MGSLRAHGLGYGRSTRTLGVHYSGGSDIFQELKSGPQVPSVPGPKLLYIAACAPRQQRGSELYTSLAAERCRILLGSVTTPGGCHHILPGGITTSGDTRIATVLPAYAQHCSRLWQQGCWQGCYSAVDRAVTRAPINIITPLQNLPLSLYIQS